MTKNDVKTLTFNRYSQINMLSLHLYTPYLYTLNYTYIDKTNIITIT